MNDRRVVILGPGPYEGMDRPSLGDEVPADVRARAHELEAATDIAGLRRLVTGLARDGITGYDVVVLGNTAGAAFEFLGADVVSDGRSLLREHLEEWRGRLNEHGLFANRADADAFLQAVGGDGFMPVARLRRSAIRPGDRLWYTVGNEHSPEDPFGRVVLTIEDDGAAALELYSRMGNGAWTGRVDADVIARIKSELARSSFPDVPREPIPAGSALRQVEVVTDDEPVYAIMSARQGETLDGYRQAFELLDAIAFRLSSGAYGGGTDTLPEGAVTDVAPA